MSVEEMTNEEIAENIVIKTTENNEYIDRISNGLNSIESFINSRLEKGENSEEANADYCECMALIDEIKSELSRLSEENSASRDLASKVVGKGL